MDLQYVEFCCEGNILNKDKRDNSSDINNVDEQSTKFAQENFSNICK